MIAKKIQMAIVTTACILGTASSVMAQATFFREPRPSLPAPRSGDPSRYERLIVAERNKVLHSVDLDRTPDKWTHRLLRISVGFHENWTPADFYGLFPQGYRESDKQAAVALDTLFIKFEKRYAPDSPPLRSVNFQGYTLSQEGEYLVVGYRDTRRWYFESPDGGRRWRLAKLGFAKHPGQFVEVEYTNQQITSLRFPSGERATITYKDGLPARIDTPWNETTLIERNNGLVSKITIHRHLPDPRNGPGKLIAPIKSFEYGYGGDYKITRFVNAYGTPFDVTSTQQETNENGVALAIYETIVRNTIDGSFSVHRHVSDKQERWRFETRWGPSLT